MKCIPNNKADVLKPIKWYKDLATRDGRVASKAFLIEGERAIKQIISTNPGEIMEILSTKQPSPFYRNYSNRLITDGQLHSISSTKTPQGMVALVRLPQNIYSNQLPSDIGDKVLLLEDVQDPGNVGTLIRNAVAFGFSGVILSEKCADPLSPKCVQSTAGTVLSLWIRRTSHYLGLVEILKNSRYPLIAADLGGVEDLSILRSQTKMLLAMGNEASGLSRSILLASNFRLRIPFIHENAESLNVSACGAICMYLSYHRC